MYWDETSRMPADFLRTDEGCAITAKAIKTARRESAGNSGLRPAPLAVPPAGEQGLRESSSSPLNSLHLKKYLELSSQSLRE